MPALVQGFPIRGKSNRPSTESVMYSTTRNAADGFSCSIKVLIAFKLKVARAAYSTLFNIFYAQHFFYFIG